MQTAADVFSAAMAKLFEVPSSIDHEDVYAALFPELLKSVMTQCADVENGYRAAMGLCDLDPSVYLARYPHNSTVPLPFRDKMTAVVFPLYIASEFLRDSGNYSMSAYMREQYVSALNEMDVCVPVETGCIL